MLPDDPRHGKNAGYLAGCRDTCCKTAHADYRRALRARQYLLKVDSLYLDVTGTRRRIQALQAIGWRYVDIDRHLGRTPRATGGTWSHSILGQKKVHVDHARALAAVYDTLSMTLGPSDRTRRRAQRSGYAVPLCWDDETIDDPKAVPLGSGQSKPNRAEVVRDLIEMGEGITQVCRRLGVSRPNLERYLMRHQMQNEWVTLLDREIRGAA